MIVLNFTSTTKINALMYAVPLAALTTGLVALAALDLSGAPAVQTSSLALAVAAMVVLWAAIGTFLRIQVRDAIRSPIRAAAQLVTQVAEGDLTARLGAVHGVTSTGETHKLLEGLEQMTADLRSVVSAATHSARTVADASVQIAQGSHELAKRTEQQAATLEETASSMEELTSTVAQNADSANRASTLAVGASEVARKGGHVMGQVVSTMTGISDSSKKIADIIGVIDGIAFQTNILALNAAVEAARAGDQGRGFAVVASEVRSLAQRSATAAKEIKDLIGESVGKVEAGTQLVDSARKTMDQIVESVKKVSDLIAEIAAASHEQSAGIGQINTAVTHMEQVVNQNASLFEQSAATSDTMKEQANSLLQLVAKFNVGGNVGGATRMHDFDPPSGRQGGRQGAREPMPALAGGPQLLETSALGA